MHIPSSAFSPMIVTASLMAPFSQSSEGMPGRKLPSITGVNESGLSPSMSDWWSGKKLLF